MTNRARAAAQRADRIRHVQEPPPNEPPQVIRQERSRPVRRTVDLSPTHHRKLADWCSETAVELGVARVTGQDVLRSLVARLLTDETLARKIRADLAEDFATR